MRAWHQYPVGKEMQTEEQWLVAWMLSHDWCKEEGRMKRGGVGKDGKG